MSLMKKYLAAKQANAATFRATGPQRQSQSEPVRKTDAEWSAYFLSLLGTTARGVIDVGEPRSAQRRGDGARFDVGHPVIVPYRGEWLLGAWVEQPHRPARGHSSSPSASASASLSCISTRNRPFGSPLTGSDADAR